MLRVTYICDRCRAEHSIETEKYHSEPSGWKYITLEVDRYNKKEILFCDNCQREFRLIKEGSKHEVRVETIADRLLDVIQEIIAENMPQG